MPRAKKREHIEKTIYESIFPLKPSKSDQTRFKILEGAVKAYADLDFESVSFDQIAAPSKISRRLIQHYFPDKEVLFQSTMKLIRAKFQQLAVDHLSKKNSPEDQFKEYVRATFYWIKNEPVEVRAWLLFYLICSQKEPYKKLHTELTTMGEHRIKALVENLAPKKRIPEKEYTYIAKAIQKIITGGLVEACTEISDNHPHRIQEDVVKACLAIVRPYI